MPAPLYHSAPWAETALTIGLDGTAVVMERFDQEAALRAIETYRVTHAQFVPTMFSRMLKLPPDVRARYDLSSLRYVLHGAAPCPIPVKQAMIDWLGPIVHEYYAQPKASASPSATANNGLSTRARSARPCTARCMCSTRR